MDNPQPMNPWQPPTGDPVLLSAPETVTTASRGRRTGRAVALVAAGAIGATALTGLAFAANNTPAPTPGSNGNAPQNGQQGRGPGDGGPGMMGGHHRGGGMMGGLGFAGRIQHGEAVVTKQDGTTATVRVQSGLITSVSATQVVVKSTDGTEWTWPIDANTKISRDRATAKATDLVAGDTVMVIGEVNGGVVTTKRIGALSPAEAKKMADRKKQFEQNHPQGQNPMPQGPNPPQEG